MLATFKLSELHPIALSISDYVPYLPLLFCFSAIFYYCLVMYAAIDFLATPATIDVAFHPPVSILKPLCGLDRTTYENLASFCRQDYPNYQIIFSFQNPSDPAITVAKQVMRDFPTIDTALVVSDHTIGANRKISNLLNALTERNTTFW